MRITCPDCAAQYELPPALAANLPARVRCARCNAEWDAGPPRASRSTPPPIADQPSTDEPLPPELQPELQPDSQPELAPNTETDTQPAGETFADSLLQPQFEPSRARAAAQSAQSKTAQPQTPSARTLWIGSLLILAAAIALILALHGPISRAWPPSLRAFRALGLG